MCDLGTAVRYGCLDREAHRSFHFVYKMYTKVCGNVVYILYTFCIHQLHKSCTIFCTECIHSFQVGSLYVPTKFYDHQSPTCPAIPNIYSVTIFNNDTFAETIPSWQISLWLHYYYTTKKMKIKGEFMNAHFEGAIYKFALTYQRGNN